MDETDTRLIGLLQENARMPVADLARALGLARTTVQARLERLETKGLITGYTVRLGGAMAPKLRATILLQIEPRSGPGVLSHLRALSGVIAVHTTSGRFDMLVEAIAEPTEALDALVDDIVEARGVMRSESLVQLSTKLDRRN